MKTILSLCVALCLVGVLTAQTPKTQTPPPPPDRVTLKNGDRISGTLKSYKLSIKLEDIQEITTAKPVAILTQDDQTVTKPIAGVQDLASAKGINIEKKPPVVWSGSVAIGASWKSGNTFERRTESTRLTGFGLLLYGEEKINRVWTLTDREYRGRLQNDWFLSKHSYLLVFAGAERDTLANLDLRFATGPGYGYQWVDTDELKFSTELGPTYTREELHGPSDTEEYVAARIRANLMWKITDDITFLQDSSYFQSLEEADDVNAWADTRLRVSLTKDMFAQLQYIFEYDNTPSKGADRRDNTVLLSVGVSF